ncbi:MAG: hydroxyacid dehydrogenase [Pseudoflavonifractor sp.]|nr:hydroxyacid dehydrogenase [Pseudoflavonifractor sp.]
MAKILVSEKVHPCGPALLEQAGHEVIYLERREQRELAEKLKDADGLFVRVMDITPEMLEEAHRLKIISKHGVGVDNIPMEAAKKRGIAVTITPGANSQAVAEHTFALLMALAKNLVPVSDAYRTIGFEAKNYPEGAELEGKILGVIGCGRIGSRVAKMGLGGFDMEVLVYDPYLEAVPKGCQKVEALMDLVRRSDAITLHAPLSQETHHMISKEILTAMKPTAYLINCARGPMVDEEALIQALKAGALAGAGLDVTEMEPANPENPLFHMANVILTPHYAPATLDTAMKVSTIGCQNLVDFFAGLEPAGRLL